jgi:hypothetical protein
MEQERKLAHIEKIEWIKPIEGADKIEVCGILGWECVIAKKDNFKAGDMVIYCEVDSIMPYKPEYEFLKDRKYRIRTIKLKGQVSQGLVLPLLSLPQPARIVINSLKEGQDVTQWLEITKYLSPSEREELEQTERRLANEKNKLKKFMMRYSWFRKLFLTRTRKQSFPYWVTKTDEERIQNIPQVLEQFKDKTVYITEKIDYQSVTFTGKLVKPNLRWLGQILPKKYQFVVCSRNMTTNTKDSLYWRIAKKYNIEEILRKNPTLTIQGEQGDTKIQGNKYGITDIRMWVFNIIDHEKKYYYNYMETKTFCDKNGLEMVHLIDFGALHTFGKTVPEIVEFSKGKSTLKDIPREGIVVRCVENGQKLLSFKVINPDFLLKFD